MQEFCTSIQFFTVLLMFNAQNIALFIIYLKGVPNVHHDAHIKKLNIFL